MFFFFFNDTATTEIYTTDTLFPYTTLFRSAAVRLGQADVAPEAAHAEDRADAADGRAQGLSRLAAGGRAGHRGDRGDQENAEGDRRRGRRAVVDPRRQPADASHDRAVRRRRLQDLPHLRAGARAVTAATGGEARFTVLVLAGDRCPPDPVSTAAGL